MATNDSTPAKEATSTKEAAEPVIKKAIALALQTKGLTTDVLLKKVKEATGHGASRTKEYLSQMVGAGEVEKKHRKLPDIKKTTFSLTEKGKKRWL
jgi:N-acetylglucosamine kinase-like BadF-type ATPase